ncbi:hypothetical protein K431DRAFT_312207 [Polychaeton citri CBS 116435]|uniref:Uncharacterized protein n=1 Tax=Polychaeton citri CBS 116435 TaxID=1314669 RepID=A0A9P4Q8Z7_9PEZI|nr:hypothetical protein K431DRAFT_312207 [Polychaeton citri CBS 116435]
MLLPSQYGLPLLHSRDAQNNGKGNTSKIAIIAVVSVAIVVSIIVLTYIVLKQVRQRHDNPKYLPTEFLKTKWRNWHPHGFLASKGSYSSRLQANNSAPTLHSRSARSSAHVPDLEQAEAREVTHNESEVNRHQSIRSIITLPAYSRSLRENERIIGREGERAGVDVVVEAPETAEEEEVRREEEMESLYQIRTQRRRENDERAQRRQQRREARERGDTAELRRLRHESLLRADQREATGAAALITEHQSRSRERRVSSVSYADLGVARHDGSRVRANSGESDRQPLMETAAGMGSSIRPWLTNDTYGSHSRNRSNSSLRSISDLDDSDVDSQVPPFGRSGSDFEVVTLGGRSRADSRVNTPGGGRSRAGSTLARPSVDTADLGQHQLPDYAPPTYSVAGFEEAPPYESPTSARPPTNRDSPAHSPQHEPVSPLSETNTPSTTETGNLPQLPTIGRLPSIRIADATPIEPRSPESFH